MKQYVYTNELGFDYYLLLLDWLLRYENAISLSSKTPKTPSNIPKVLFYKLKIRVNFCLIVDLLGLLVNCSTLD